MASAMATREVIDRPESLRFRHGHGSGSRWRSVPLEATITVVPAESEIIVSPPYDI
jgi:hypothetical protein